MRLKNYKLFFLIAFTGTTIQAQLNKPTQVSELSLSGYKARILNGGDLFFTYSNTPGFEIPRVTDPNFSGKGTMAAAAIWIGAYDENNVLHTAVMQFRQNGVDYYPGPITSDSVNSTMSYDRIFGTTSAEITQLKNSGFTDVSSGIGNWPARDTSFFANRPLAPFFDKNNDKRYNPYGGDYPLINGHAAHYILFNDKGPHTEGGGLPLEVDVEAMVYGFNSSDTALKNTMFVNYAVTNRSKHTYKRFYISMWVDFDIGNYADDMAGCDTSRSMFFGYNGDDNDEGADGYGYRPPAQGVVFLNHKMNSFYTFENSLDSINGTPLYPLEFYHCMEGKKINGSYVKDLGNKATRYSFYGNIGEQGQYNALNAGKSPSDIRGIGSIGPYTLPPNETICLDVAFITALGGNSPYQSVPILQRYADVISDIYNNGNDITKNILCSNKQMLGINSAAVFPSFRIYPNPSEGLLHIGGLDPMDQNRICIYSSEGRLVHSAETDGQNELTIDLSELCSGIYQVVIHHNKGIYQASVIKQ